MKRDHLKLWWIKVKGCRIQNDTDRSFSIQNVHANSGSALTQQPLRTWRWLGGGRGGGARYLRQISYLPHHHDVWLDWTRVQAKVSQMKHGSSWHTPPSHAVSYTNNTKLGGDFLIRPGDKPCVLAWQRKEMYFDPPDSCALIQKEIQSCGCREAACCLSTFQRDNVCFLPSSGMICVMFKGSGSTFGRIAALDLRAAKRGERVIDGVRRGGAGNNEEKC